MIKSKRFWVLTISSLVWIIAVVFFSQDAVHFGEGLALMVAPYLAAETVRPSDGIAIWQSNKTE
jgi:hypothetical protein